jgi:hypothetical protein
MVRVILTLNRDRKRLEVWGTTEMAPKQRDLKVGKGCSDIPGTERDDCRGVLFRNLNLLRIGTQRQNKTFLNFLNLEYNSFQVENDTGMGSPLCKRMSSEVC